MELEGPPAGSWNLAGKLDAIADRALKNFWYPAGLAGQRDAQRRHRRADSAAGVNTDAGSTRTFCSGIVVTWRWKIGWSCVDTRAYSPTREIILLATKLFGRQGDPVCSPAR
jgi:hypothetical protein